MNFARVEYGFLTRGYYPNSALPQHGTHSRVTPYRNNIGEQSKLIRVLDSCLYRNVVNRGTQ